MICSDLPIAAMTRRFLLPTTRTLSILTPFPGTIQGDISGMRSFPPAVRKRNIHRDSLLAWTEDVVTTRSRSASNVLLRSLEKGMVKQVKKKLSADEKKLAAMPFEALVKNYLEEAKKPSARSRSLEASIRSPELLGTINKFSEALFKTTKAQRPKAFKSGTLLEVKPRSRRPWITSSKWR